MESRLTPVSACYKNSYGHKVINGYTVVNKLGQGSFGKVKVCTRDGVQYAVKIFNKAILRRRREFMKNEKGGGMKFHTALDDVMKEVEVMRRFTHNNVVRLVEVLDDQENDKLYLIQDLCGKGPLLHWDSTARLFTCRFAPQMTENQLRLLLRGMLLGMDYRNPYPVHYNGIAHRDIKPQNILVTVDDIVKVCDFGQAMVCDSSDLTSKTVGTIQFFPPECCGNTPEAFSALGADMWALGLTLYSLVFRELPFFAETFLEVMEAIQRFQLVLKRPVSREVRFFLERLLDTNPRTRAKVWELIQHPWLAKPHRENSGPDSPTMVGFLRLARVVLAYIENVQSEMAPTSPPASRPRRNLPPAIQTTDRLTSLSRNMHTQEIPYIVFALGTPTLSTLQLQLYLQPAYTHPDRYPEMYAQGWTVVHSVIYALLLWSYLVCAQTDSRAYPAIVRPTQIGSGNSYCEKCKMWRPPRSHHCSRCGHCSLRMDHHCAFIGRCVGRRNYKAFVLFLVHAFVLGTIMWWHMYRYYCESGDLVTDRSWPVHCFFWGENAALVLGHLFVSAMICSHSLMVTINVTSLEYKKGTPLYYPGTNPVDVVLSIAGERVRPGQ